jgi:hypothetical protein
MHVLAIGLSISRNAVRASLRVGVLVALTEIASRSFVRAAFAYGVDDAAVVLYSLRP